MTTKPFRPQLNIHQDLVERPLLWVDTRILCQVAIFASFPEAVLFVNEPAFTSLFLKALTKMLFPKTMPVYSLLPWVRK